MDSFKGTAFCVLTVAVMIEYSSADWLQRSIRSAENQRTRRNHKNVESNDIVEGDGFLHSFKQQKASTDCCFNGGLCIMNTFCHCPEGFHGRYCEHKTHDRSCGSIQHGTWMAKGCFLCHCFDGKMRCKTSEIPNCESFSFNQGKEFSPDYQVDVDKKFADYERFYDVSEDDIKNSYTSGTSVPVPVCLSGIVVLVLIGLKFGS